MSDTKSDIISLGESIIVGELFCWDEYSLIVDRVLSDSVEDIKEVADVPKYCSPEEVECGLSEGEIVLSPDVTELLFTSVIFHSSVLAVVVGMER